MRHVVGLDLGQVADSSGLVVVEVNILPVLGNRLVSDGYLRTVTPVFLLPDGTQTTQHPPRMFDVRHIERIKPGTPYPAIVDRVRTLFSKLTKPTLAIDATGVGRATVGLFRNAKLKPEVLTITAGDRLTDDSDDHVIRVPKNDLVSTAQVMLQTGTLRIAKALPLAEILLRELQSFRMTMPLRSTPDQPMWREGAQDDLVLALAIALWVADEKVKVPRPVWWAM